MPLTRPLTVSKFVQAAPAATWNINHGLGGYPVLDVYITANGSVQKVLPQAVTYVDDNNCTVTFSTPLAGFATIIV